MKITVQPFDTTIECDKGEIIRDVLQRAGFDTESPCNGEGRCGGCGIWVDDPDTIAETPHQNITSDKAKRGLRLGCRLSVERDMTIHLTGGEMLDTSRVLEDNGFDDFSRKKRLVKFEENDVWEFDPAAVIETGDASKATLRYDKDSKRVLEIWQADYRPKGLAIDIGTTTIVATLVSLEDGRELQTASSLNPQIRFGHDIMTRIEHGATDEGLKEMALTVRDGVNELITKLCKETNSAKEEIVDVVLGANTTMLEIMAGIDPTPLGQTPFTVSLEGGKTYCTETFGLVVNPQAVVYIPPIMHAFVGADVAAGLLVCESLTDTETPLLFIDIGTNGELGMHIENQWVVTSAASGPAFEGMGLSCGMRALEGAVESVEEKDGELAMRIIGDVEPLGVCGSGIIDLTAELLHLGVLQSSGRILASEQAEKLPKGIQSRLVTNDDVKAFAIGEDVHFTQLDVRQLQLAKGAIRTAIDLLCAHKEKGKKVGKVIVAGGFGYTLSPSNMETIGMIPKGMAKKVRFAGNTCRFGCVQLLRDVKKRRLIEKRVENVEHCSLVESTEYMEAFVENMEFPEQVPNVKPEESSSKRVRA